MFTLLRRVGTVGESIAPQRAKLASSGKSTPPCRIRMCVVVHGWYPHRNRETMSATTIQMQTAAFSLLGNAGIKIQYLIIVVGDKPFRMDIVSR